MLTHSCRALGLLATLMIFGCPAHAASTRAMPAATGAVQPAAIWFAPRSSMPVVNYIADDFMNLFQPGAPWQQAESHVRVFKLYSQFVSTSSPAGGATDAELRTVLTTLQQHHIAVAIEAGLLTNETLCGKIEGYSCDATQFGTLLARIKALGGTLSYVAMDEPLWFGHIANQAGALHTPIADLAHDVANQVAVVHRYFPQAKVGDIEPVVGVAGPADYVSEVARFADAYRAATGLPLAFFHSDVAWRAIGAQQQLPQLAQVAHARGERFGIIYNSSDPDVSPVWPGRPARN